MDILSNDCPVMGEIQPVIRSRRRLSALKAKQIFRYLLRTRILTAILRNFRPHSPEQSELAKFKREYPVVMLLSNIMLLYNIVLLPNINGTNSRKCEDQPTARRFLSPMICYYYILMKALAMKFAIIIEMTQHTAPQQSSTEC